MTEQRCPVRPTCTFNGVGPGGVGVGSLAGMRFLHHIKQTKNMRVAVWPFDRIHNADLVIVEIFPRLFASMKSFEPMIPKRADGQRWTEDQYDALLSAAALRKLSTQRECWDAGDSQSRSTEGWIFGVD